MPKAPQLEPGISYRYGAYHYRWYDRISRKQKSRVLARGKEGDAETIRKANKRRREIIGEIEETGGYTRKSLTFDEVFRLFIQDGGKRGRPFKPSTVVDYENIYYGRRPKVDSDDASGQAVATPQGYNLQPYFGRCRIEDITIDAIRGFRTHLDSLGGSDGSTGRRRRDLALLLLKSILSYAHHHRYINYNPGAYIQVSQTAKVERAQPDRAMIEDLLAATPEHWRPFVEAAAYLGTRPNETISLQWQDIEFRDESSSTDAFPTVHINRGTSRGKLVDRPKTSAGFRSIPIPGRLERTLLGLRDKRKQDGTYGPEEFVFKTEKGQMVNLDNFRTRVWSKAKESAGLSKGGKWEDWSDFKFYDLRSLYLTWLSSRGVPAALLTQIAGHESFQTSLRYMGRRKKELKVVLDIFDDNLSTKTNEGSGSD